MYFELGCLCFLHSSFFYFIFVLCFMLGAAFYLRDIHMHTYIHKHVYKRMRNWGRTFVFSFCIVRAQSRVNPANYRCHLRSCSPVASALRAYTLANIMFMRWHFVISHANCDNTIIIGNYINISIKSTNKCGLCLTVPKEKTEVNNNVIYYIIGSSLFAVLVVVLIFSLAFYRRRKQAHFNEIPTVSLVFYI